MNDHEETSVEEVKKLMESVRKSSYEPFFYGRTAFDYLWKEKRLIPTMTMLRVFNYGTTYDAHYTPTRDGKLERIVHIEGQKHGIFEIEEILALDKTPDGWCVTNKTWAREEPLPIPDYLQPTN